MARLLDWEAMQTIDEGGDVILSLTSLQALFLQACSAFYDSRYSWVYGANDVTDEQWNAIDLMRSDTELALMGNMIGLILPNVLADISNIGVLDCDGETYLRVDYPILYDVIADHYIIDADNFFVPDLRNRFPSGASATVPIGTTGGEEEVTLDIDTLPSHGHTNVPHVHTAMGAVASVTALGAGVPTPAALATPVVTDAVGVTINNTGNGEAHNNIPPYEAISYVIVAG